MKSYLIIPILLSSFTCCAQQNIVFKDGFENFDNKWTLVNNEQFKVEQQEGKLHIVKTNTNKVSNGCLWYRKTILSFYANKNFEIQFDAKSISSEFKTRCFDFNWGRMQRFDGVRKEMIYQLDFDLDKVRLTHFQLGKGWEYYPWSNELMDISLSKFRIERGSFNNFQIIQKDNVLLVSVNKVLVYKIPIEPQVGSEVGFQQCIQSEWQMDNLVIIQ